MQLKVKVLPHGHHIVQTNQGLHEELLLPEEGCPQHEKGLYAAQVLWSPPEVLTLMWTKMRARECTYTCLYSLCVLPACGICWVVLFTGPAGLLFFPALNSRVIQDLPAWQCLGMYTGEIQLSEYTENLSANADDGLGFLLYDKSAPPLHAAKLSTPCPCFS